MARQRATQQSGKRAPRMRRRAWTGSAKCIPLVRQMSGKPSLQADPMIECAKRTQSARRENGSILQQVSVTIAFASRGRFAQRNSSNHVHLVHCTIANALPSLRVAQPNSRLGPQRQLPTVCARRLPSALRRNLKKLRRQNSQIASVNRLLCATGLVSSRRCHPHVPRIDSAHL